MNFDQFKKCDEAHWDKYEYCCMRNKKVFCGKCWLTDHAMRCASSRCGHYEKIAHLVIEKVLQMKTLHYASEMSSNYERFKKFKNQILSLKDFFIDSLKKEVQMKVPLFLQAMLTQMLDSKMKNVEKVTLQEEICGKMLRIIKDKSKNFPLNLYSSIKNYEQICDQVRDFENRLHTKDFNNKNQKQIQDSLAAFQKLITQINSKLRKNMKDDLQSEIKTALNKFDPKIAFDGIRLPTKPIFSDIEKYNSPNIALQCFPSLSSPNAHLYCGFNLDVEKAEQSPQIILQVSKNFLKEKIHEMYSKIKSFKSNYPYKYGYVIATTVEPDEDYELQVLKMEKKVIKTLQKKSDKPFLNSINIVIMGPQCIVIEYKKKTQIQCCIKIHGYTEKRKEAIENIIKTLDLKDAKTEIEKKKIEIPYSKQISPLSVAYVNLQLAYEHLFQDEQYICVNDRVAFDGQGFVEVRGSKLYKEISGGWRERGQMDLRVKKGEGQLQMLMI